MGSYTKSKKIFWEEILAIFKVSGFQLSIISLLIGFLLFVLNIFLIISLVAGNLSGSFKDKLGMYFYIKDVPGQEGIVYKEIMELKDDLQSQGLEVAFSSKEDAFKFLENRLPNVVTNFEKFGIGNPLPATLYVMFNNEKQYEILRDSIIKHKKIIMNIKDIDRGKTLKQQENRILTIIIFSNFVKVGSYILVGVITLIIMFFLIFLLENIFQRFRKDLEIKKMLGATNVQNIKSFLGITGIVMFGSYLISSGLIVLAMFILNHFITRLFNVGIFELLGVLVGSTIGFIIIEYIIILFFVIIFAYFFVSNLNRKI